MRERRGMVALTGLLLLAGLPAGTGRAAIDGVRFCPATGHWYRLYVETPGAVPWPTARSRAESVGGYLATVTSATEQQWIVANVQGGLPAFLGGTDEATEGTWQWVTAEPWSYTNWAPGEPATHPGDYLRLQADGTWCPGGGGGAATNGYIVEWNQDPNGTGPPPPPPPPTGTTDLVVLSVSLSPSSPALGEAVQAGYAIRNVGGVSGPSTVRLGLEGFAGPPLAERTLPSLSAGATTSGTLSGRIPDDLPSGEYHATLLVSADSLRDLNPADNLGRVARAFRVERAPIDLAPGKILQPLGPLGRQVFRLACFPELRSTLKSKLSGGDGTARLVREGDDAVLAEGEGKLSASVAGEDGPVDLVVESLSDRSAKAKVRLSVETIRLSGEIDLGADPQAISIPGLPGMTATVKLAGLDGAIPALDVSGLAGPEAVKAKRARVKAKGLVLSGEGPWEVRVSATEGAAGRASYKVTVK